MLWHDCAASAFHHTTLTTLLWHRISRETGRCGPASLAPAKSCSAIVKRCGTVQDYIILRRLKFGRIRPKHAIDAILKTTLRAPFMLSNHCMLRFRSFPLVNRWHGNWWLSWSVSWACYVHLSLDFVHSDATSKLLNRSEGILQLFCYVLLISLGLFLQHD